MDKNAPAEESVYFRQSACGNLVETVENSEENRIIGRFRRVSTVENFEVFNIFPKITVENFFRVCFVRMDFRASREKENGRKISSFQSGFLSIAVVRLQKAKP